MHTNSATDIDAVRAGVVGMTGVKDRAVTPLVAPSALLCSLPHTVGSQALVDDLLR